MRPIIKVWPLPPMSEERLQELLARIVKACHYLPCFQEVLTEDDILCQFSQDMMLKGIGDELIIEIIASGRVPTRYELMCFGQSVGVLLRRRQRKFKFKTTVNFTCTTEQITID